MSTPETGAAPGPPVASGSGRFVTSPEGPTRLPASPDPTATAPFNEPEPEQHTARESDGTVTPSTPADTRVSEVDHQWFARVQRDAAEAGSAGGFGDLDPSVLAALDTPPAVADSGAAQPGTQGTDAGMTAADGPTGPGAAEEKRAPDAFASPRPAADAFAVAWAAEQGEALPPLPAPPPVDLSEESIRAVAERLTDGVAARLTDTALVDALTERLTRGLTDRLIGGVADRVSEALPGPIAAGVADRIAGGLGERLSHELPVRVSSPLSEWLAGEIPDRLLAPILERVSSDVSSLGEPLAARVADRVADRLASDLPERVIGGLAERLAHGLAEQVAAHVAAQMMQHTFGDALRQTVHDVAERLVREEIARIRAAANDPPASAS